MNGHSVQEQLISKTKSATLCAVLMNPPSPGGGRLTHSRVKMAADILCCTNYYVTNLIEIATKSTSHPALSKAVEDDWTRSRGRLKEDIFAADVVLLAFGSSRLSGPARRHQQAQERAVESYLDWDRQTILWFNGRPLHPSRWHRETFRARQGWPFRDAVEDLLKQPTDQDVKRWANSPSAGKTPPVV
jgi:hypothetical protein